MGFNISIDFDRLVLFGIAVGFSGKTLGSIGGVCFGRGEKVGYTCRG